MHTSDAERWFPVAGFETLYEVSDAGRVRSLGRTDSTGKHRKPRVLRGSIDGAGYRVFGLAQASQPGVPGQQVFLRGHTLVLTAFVGPCPPEMECCHNNGVPGDNRLGNLRWDTSASNSADIAVHGTFLTGDAARSWRSEGRRSRPPAGFCIRGHRLIDPNLTSARRKRCRACSNAHNRVRDALRLKGVVLDLEEVAAQEYRRVMQLDPAC